ncbi:MAG: tRNA pseudouridine(55) synthase TruB [Candidatus Pacebacteria bacterium]|nr:tRNA pseudouridine(55) synthase TruB [Candidatus Paceibacterota bacterium]
MTMIKPASALTTGSQGVFMFDKPIGLTSHDVVDQVRKITGIKKVGHAGTLDPLATGLLIILVGRTYTKQQSRFLKLDKEYLVTAQLGATTDTYDLEGQVTSQAPWEQVTQLSQTQLASALAKFTGKIIQTVPAFSAVKIRGEKLYRQARKGQFINQLPQRKVNIKQLTLLNWQVRPKQQASLVTLQVACSSGTYIRSLIHELGQELQIGAVVTKLKRFKIGKIKIKGDS